MRHPISLSWRARGLTPSLSVHRLLDRTVVGVSAAREGDRRCRILKISLAEAAGKPTSL